ncbi:hypothetical protein ACFLU5_11850 [Bacteroidota bacterium]
MKKKILIGIIAVLGIALTIFNPVVIGVLAIATWIYLLLIVRKRETGIFHDQMEPRLAERRLKRLKAFMILAGISCLVSIAGIIVHNVRSGLSEIEEPISFYIGIVALYLFILATAGGLIIFLKGRQKAI